MCISTIGRFDRSVGIGQLRTGWNGGGSAIAHIESRREVGERLADPSPSGFLVDRVARQSESAVSAKTGRTSAHPGFRRSSARSQGRDH